MFEKFFKNKSNNLYAPVNGKTIALENVADNVFASKMMGEGIAFKLQGDTVYAPCDGILTVLPQSKHAFGIIMENGAEVLVHIGLDTVELNGEGFTCYKKVGDKVRHGSAVIKLDESIVENKDLDLTTMLIVTNWQDYKISIVQENLDVYRNETEVIKFE
ncbi:MAG: PTS glucose transporter subunit IIA [Anaerorhabdus sp.]